MWISISTDFGNQFFKEKKNQKKKEEKEWAIAHNLLVRFLEAWLQCIYLAVSIIFEVLLTLVTFNVWFFRHTSDLNMKAKALACCEVEGNTKQTTHWRDKKDLMAFLESL